MERQALPQDQDPHKLRLLLVLLEQVPQPGRDGLFSAHNFSKSLS